METVKAAEGRTDFDRGMMEELADQPAPGDVDVESPGDNSSSLFGIPEPDDPDPFGVLALEKEGLEIREAGTKVRPASTQFEFNPSPTSPVYDKFHRRSTSTTGYQSNRGSYISNRTTWTSTDRVSQTTEAGTQTDANILPIISNSISNSDYPTNQTTEEEKVTVTEPKDVDYTKIDLGEFSHLNHSEDFDGTTVNESPRGQDENEQGLVSHETSFAVDDDLDDEEPVIFEAASTQATVITPQAIKARGGLVNIPKRPAPPPLPPRNLARTSKVVMIDEASGQSPMMGGFEDVELHAGDRASAEAKRRNSISQSQPEETATSTPPGFSKVEETLKEEHVLEKDSKDGHSLETETEEFHSLPVTPMERPVEVN